MTNETRARHAMLPSLPATKFAVAARKKIAWLAISLFTASGSVHAAPDADSDTAGRAEDGLHGNVGIGAMWVPRYAGSADKRVLPVPVIGLSYGRFFAGAVDGAPTVPFGIGAYLYQSEHLKAGIALSYDIYSVRKESVDESRLHGLGNVDQTAHATAFARYSRDWYILSASVTTDVGGKGQGTQVRVGADAHYALSPRFILNAGPGLTWSSGEANRTFYGVDAVQSVRSGYAPYAPTSGISEVSFSMGATYLLTKKWSISALTSLSYLPANIGDSPIVGSKLQQSAGVFTSYRF
jgi:MipA family protein